MAAQGASSSSFSGSFTNCYDVFLNFRGEDTRNNFTGFLHRALKREGIDVFIDDDELCSGEEIRSALLEAIRGSRISIPVFSKGYADSKWCLLELTEIVRCHRSNCGQIILPIFLDDIEPTDVRHQTGSFEGSFQKHEEKFGVQTIQSWKEALNLVGGIKGYHLKQVNWNQSKLIDLVVDRVLSESSSNRMGDVKNPIGLDSRVKDLLSMVNVGSSEIQFVGICGIGGIGKTTIAKSLYNRILNSFHSCCFLANIKGEASGPNGLVSLQEQLICNVSKRRVDRKIWNVDGGKELIKQNLQGENVLLILDDVDDRSQLEAFAIEFNWFGSGSRIIITSRDEHILNVAKVDRGNIYWPEELNDEQSLQLFSLHAFSRDQPPEDYKQLSKDVLHLAGRLPLTLEVLGSAFCDIREKEEWKSKLEDLKRIPHEEILQKLKISYDNLKDNEKSIFLDAACFFVGWRKETVISVWDACGFNPVSAIKKLTQRSLIKFTNEVSYDKYPSIDYYDELRMHDQIQAMGRGIVYGENLMEPGERSRLWSCNKILEILKERKGTQKIEGILLRSKYKLFPWDKCLNKKKIAACLHKEDFAMMSKLRFLYIQVACFVADFPHLPSSLRWLSWKRCCLETVQDNFYHKKLVYMDLSGSQIRQAWTKKPQSENQFQKLKVLRLQHCQYLFESPDFSWFPYLERLDLRGCKSIVNLDTSIGDLKSLVELDLRGTKIKELPDSICRLSSLKCLILGQCLSLEKLPQSIGDLKSLVELDFHRTKIEELSDSICRQSSLKKLDLNGCELLKKLPELPSTLTCWNIGNCSSLQKLPDLSCLKNVQELRLQNYKKLEEIQGLGGMKSLEEILVYGCDTIESLPELPSTLTYLEVGICISLKKLPDFSSLKNLREIKLSNCKKLEEIRGLGETESLEDFLMYECDNIESLPELPSTLARLEVGKCFSLQKLPDLSSLKNLKELKIYDCKKLEEIRGLGGTKFLKKLSLYECDIIESLSELPLALSDLNVGNCVSLQKLPDFSTLKNLRELRLRNCKKLEEIRGLGGSGSLEEFSVHECDTIESLPKLPSTLARLDVVNCISLQKLPSLSNLKNLRETCLFKCKKLEEIRGLEETKSLEWFAISIYETITDAPGKILGQGTLLVNPFSSSNSLNVNDGKYNKLVLCLVFALDRGNVQEVLIKLTASIRRKDRRRTLCDFEITIESIELTSERDMIYIHQFKGFELFGFPLEGIDAIEEIIVKGGYDCKVKFWKLILLENTEPEQEIPNQESSARMVADFFRWSYHDDDDDAGEEMKIVSYPSSYEDGDNRDSHPSTNEGMLRATKRARLDVDEEAGGPSGA